MSDQATPPRDSEQDDRHEGEPEESDQNREEAPDQSDADNAAADSR